MLWELGAVDDDDDCVTVGFGAVEERTAKPVPGTRATATISPIAIIAAIIPDNAMLLTDDIV